MKRFRFLALFASTCLAVVTLPLLRRIFSLTLCGLLFANSSVCYDLFGSSRAQAAAPRVEAGAVPEGMENMPRSPQEIAVPPIIREAPIDLQNALPDDFVVSRQTPYSSGRNEVLIVSPSTGTEQRFEINLPGTTGGFRLYQASFNKVVIDDPVRIVGDASSLSPAQIQAKLESFTINFDSSNLPSEIILADGTKAEFSSSEAIIRSAGGQVIETVSLSSSVPSNELSASVKSSNTMIAQASSGCEGRIRNQIYDSGRSAGSKADVLRNAQSDEGKTFAWTLTYGKRAMEDSLVATTRNQTLQEVACKPPVQCNQAQTYEGGSEIRTDLFQLPSGINQEVNLEYEFYEIPDRLELYYEGNLVFGVGPASGQATRIINNLPDRAAYVGVKLIGNENTNTRWWYTISCLREEIPADLQEAQELARQLREEYSGWLDNLDSCPCTVDAARRDNRFVEATDDYSIFFGLYEPYREHILPAFHPGAHYDFRTAAGRVGSYSPRSSGLPPLRPGQQCTYDIQGKLITAGEGAGTPDAYSPEVTIILQGTAIGRLITNDSHTYWDVKPFEADGMSWQEYQETWIPNQGVSCPINTVP